MTHSVRVNRYARRAQTGARVLRRRAPRIARVLGARMVTFSDTGQSQLSIEWEDEKGKRGFTSGAPANPHMQELAKRAAREKVGIMLSHGMTVLGPGDRVLSAGNRLLVLDRITTGPVGDVIYWGRLDNTGPMVKVYGGAP